VLFSAGLITGEALIGIVMAVPIVASGKADVLADGPPRRDALGGGVPGSSCISLFYRCAIQ
jgi:hypothetical protein